MKHRYKLKRPLHIEIRKQLKKLIALREDYDRESTNIPCSAYPSMISWRIKIIGIYWKAKRGDKRKVLK